MASNIAIQISSNVQQAVNGINAVNQRLEALQKDTESVSSRFQRLSSIAGGATIVFNTISQAFQKASAAVRACVEAYSTQEQAERRLQTVLTATQDAVGMSAQELFNLAESLQAVTTYSDQEIIAVEQVLAATRKISRSVMPQATKAVLDMAAATGEDATNAAERLAQALADPAGEIESLKEAGIQLSEEQKKNVQTAQDQNDIYAAQQIILDEVAGTYGDMAQAIADTDTGKLEKIGNVWQDIKEGLGEGLLNAISPALDWLYERLQDINGIIEEMNEAAASNERIRSINEQGAKNIELSEYSDEELQQALAGNPYTLWLNDWNMLPQEGVSLNEARNNAMGIRFSLEDYQNYAAIISEQARRRAEEALGSLPTAIDIGSYNAGISSSSSQSFDFLNSAFPAATLFSSDYSNGWNEGYGGTLYKDINGINGGLIAARIGIGSSYNADDPLNSFLGRYSGLSTSAQIESINEKIRESSKYMLQVDPDSEAYKQLSEINDALWEQKDALMANEKESETYMDRLQKAFENVDQYMQPILSIGDSFATIMQNMADSAADKLQEIEEKWDEYFDDLDEKQERQSDSLNALLASGNISYEDYIDAMNELDESRAEAEEEAQKEKEEQQKKANELGQAAFIANQVNSIAEASMNIAQGVTEAIAQGGVAGIALGSIVAAAGAAQIAAIASQQYTPMAAGGIVTSPTHALIGEGGSPEAIIPLNDSNADRFGLTGSGSGVINITVNIGTAYSSEQISEDVFRGIERAQRTGALPHWRYA